ncbi:hemopexin repeat-containing protein [Brevibacillus sp. AG]|uniref:hemopexin repeat-containing protein n=1 Tax=Brevibacillus sp. AG TaxID=3020891 RepID=UPI0008537AA2|nr:hemopexin repeat-containing protein [Brevibacillus sp. AG]MDC0759248.1 hemopexin repeat-containing protein [Brevibacillus sp. AG]
MGTKVYFFARDKYVRYDRGDDMVDDGYNPPLCIADYWQGMKEVGFDKDLDTAINWGDGKVYFFKKDKYVRYDIAMDKVDDGYNPPLSIADYWHGMKEVGFDKDLDTAINWGNGKVYFFKKDKYVRYDIAMDKVDDGYNPPLSIADYWHGMKEVGFDKDLDTAINWGDGKVYFFKKDKYVRYDIAMDKVDDGYNPPLSIADYWPGMKESGIVADLGPAFDLLDLSHEIWVPGAEKRPRQPVGPKYKPMPWRGVLHTTEGDNLSGAEGEFDSKRIWPHLVIDPKTLKIVQYIPLNVGARSMGDAGGTLASNSAHCVQIEIVGRAKDSPNLPPEHLAFIREVMRQVDDLVPIPRRSGRTFLNEAGVNANPGNRMSVQEWTVFSGWCGHQHVPGQNHWDPGAIDIDSLL